MGWSSKFLRLPISLRFGSNSSTILSFLISIITSLSFSLVLRSSIFSPLSASLAFLIVSIYFEHSSNTSYPSCSNLGRRKIPKIPEKNEENPEANSIKLFFPFLLLNVCSSRCMNQIKLGNKTRRQNINKFFISLLKVQRSFVVEKKEKTEQLWQESKETIMHKGRKRGNKTERKSKTHSCP